MDSYFILSLSWTLIFHLFISLYCILDIFLGSIIQIR